MAFMPWARAAFVTYYYYDDYHFLFAVLVLVVVVVEVVSSLSLSSFDHCYYDYYYNHSLLVTLDARSRDSSRLQFVFLRHLEALYCNKMQ